MSTLRNVCLKRTTPTLFLKDVIKFYMKIYLEYSDLENKCPENESSPKTNRRTVILNLRIILHIWTFRLTPVPISPISFSNLTCHRELSINYYNMGVSLIRANFLTDLMKITETDWNREIKTLPQGCVLNSSTQIITDIVKRWKLRPNFELSFWWKHFFSSGVCLWSTWATIRLMLFIIINHLAGSSCNL